MRGFQKGITLSFQTSCCLYIVGLQNRVAKNLHKFATELQFLYRVTRGFQKCITLGSRTSRSAHEVAGGWGGRIGLSGLGLGYLAQDWAIWPRIGLSGPGLGYLA